MSLLSFLVRLASFVWPALSLAAAVAWAVDRARAATGTPPPPPAPRSAWFVLLLASLLLSGFAAYASVVPFRWARIGRDEAWQRARDFADSSPAPISKSDFAANVLLFLPIAFVWQGTFCPGRRPFAWAILAPPLVATLCLVLSVAVELAQFWCVTRVPSPSDVLAHFLGTAFGILAWIACGPIMLRWLGRYPSRQRPKQQVDWLLEAYAVGLVLYSVLPLELSPSPAALARKLRDGQINLVPGRDLSWTPAGLGELVRDILLFVPIGMLARSWRVPRGAAVRSFAASLVQGVGLAVAVETVQAMIDQRTASVTDLLSAAVGVAIGSWCIARWRADLLATPEEPPRATSRQAWAAALLAIGYGGWLVYFFCQPIAPIRDSELIRARWEAFHWIPFASLQIGSEFNAINQVLRKCLLFAPLGVLASLAIAGTTRRRWSRTLAMGVALLLISGLGLGIELLQVFLPPHVPDITDVLLYAVGGAAGLLITARIVGRGT